MLTEGDVKRLYEPYGEEFATFPKSMQHIGLGNSKVNTLVGEEAKRLTRYPFQAFISSSDQMGISQKEEDIKDMWLDRLISLAQERIMAEAEGKQIPEEELQEQITQELKKYDKFIKYSYQDLKEIVANKILKYEYNRLKIGEKFLRCWEDFLITGEEIVCIEEVGGDISFRKVNPLNIYTVQSSETYKIEDADLIVEFYDMSIGQAIDSFHKELNTKQIKSLENGTEYQTSANGGIKMAYNRDITIQERYGIEDNDLSELSPITPGFAGSAFDGRGNVRVMRMCWRSRRKIGILSFYDEDGAKQEKVVDEYYLIKKDEGETVKWQWINEWWEGTKIANDIYVKIRPIPYQSRSRNNLSESKPPYVGSFCNTNSSKVFSFYDSLKPMDYQYDIYFHRLNLMMSKYKGPMLAINTSMIPSEWDPLKWLKYGEATNILFMDPTNEVLKGPLQGKSAGTYNQLAASAVDLDMGNAIRQHVETLGFIKQQMDLISGVNEYRQGDIKGDSNVGTANIGWQASNSMTEKYFSIHNAFKRDCMERLLEVAKYVWKKSPQKVQAVLDGMGAEIVSSYDEFSESQYDVFIDDGPNTQEMLQSLTQLAHAGMQTGQIKFRDLIELYKKESVSALARYLEEAQDKVAEEQMEAQNRQMKHEAKLAEEKRKETEAALALEYAKLDRIDMNSELDRQNRIQIETIKALGFAQDTDVNDNQVPDVLEQSKIALEQQSMSYEHLRKNKEIASKEKIETQKIKIKEKEIESKEKIEKLKAETALKVAKQNKNKYDK